MAFAIGGKRVLGQAAKYTGREDTFGDAQSDSVVCECKARDPAPKKWRENNPQLPYNKIKIEVGWLVKIVAEAKAINKVGFLAYNIKYTGISETYIIQPLAPLPIDIELAHNTIKVDPKAKQFTFSIYEVPTYINIDGHIFICDKLKNIMKDGLFKYKTIEELLKAWKDKKDDKQNEQSDKAD